MRGAPTSAHAVLAAELELARVSGNAPSLAQASFNQWGGACYELWEAGRIETTEFAARLLHREYPEQPLPRTLVAYFDALPRHLPPPLPFCDVPAAEIQLVRRPDCEKLVLCFCAANGTLGLPLNFIHQWLGRLPASLVYIKDFRNLRGGCGFPTLGPDRASAVVAFRRMIRDVDARRVYTLGVSLGGYAALYYGLELGAAAVLSLAGASDYTPEFIGSLKLVSPAWLEFRNGAPDYVQLLPRALETAPQPPRVLMAYGARHFHDRRQAERIAGLPNVELVPVDCAKHNVLDPLVRDLTLMPLLQRFLAL